MGCPTAAAQLVGPVASGAAGDLARMSSGLSFARSYVAAGDPASGHDAASFAIIRARLCARSIDVTPLSWAEPIPPE